MIYITISSPYLLEPIKKKENSLVVPFSINPSKKQGEAFLGFNLVGGAYVFIGSDIGDDATIPSPFREVGASSTVVILLGRLILQLAFASVSNIDLDRG